MVLSETEEAKVSQRESSMRSTFIVTFNENNNTYSMDLTFDGLRYSILFSKKYSGREQNIMVTFLQEDLYQWIARNPLEHPGGMYGICFYVHEVRNCPKWVCKFAHCFV